MAKKKAMTAASNDPFALPNVASNVVDEMKDGTTSQTPVIEPGYSKATSGAAAGCKPGSTRHTYVMPYDMINKLKAIAGYHGKPEVAIVLEMLNKGIEEQEQIFGPQVSDINRGHN